MGPPVSVFADSGTAPSNPPSGWAYGRGLPPPSPAHAPQTPKRNQFPNVSAGPKLQPSGLAMNLPVGYGVGANQQISPNDTNSYTEPGFAGDSNNKSNLAAGSNIGSTCSSSLQPEGGFRSLDSGATWTTSNPPQPAGTYPSDPALAFGGRRTLCYA